MSNLLITQIVVAVAAAAGLGLFGWLVAVPSISAREGFWQRLGAGLLSGYLFFVLVGVGVAAAVGSLLLWPQLF